MKKRTQIQLDPEEHEALKAWAHNHGLSMSAGVRWLIRSHLLKGGGKGRVKEKLLSASGVIRGGDGDEDEVSVRHDAVLRGGQER
jgi:hypothetical protein